MTTYRELIYICLDLVKGQSDDFSYTEEHVAFLLDKYRALLLKQRYGNDPKKYIPTDNYSNIIINIQNNKSTNYIPKIMNIGIPRVTLFKEEDYCIHSEQYYSYNVEYVVRERFPFVGNNKYLKNIKYCTIDPYNLLLTKGIEDDTTLSLTAVLETPVQEEGKDKIDSVFPLEESLIPNLIQMVVKDLLPASYRPEDSTNNANDDLATLAGYLSRLLKKPYSNNLTTEDTSEE
jgi:hypothetical protein